MTSSLTPIILFEEQSAVLRLRFCTLDFLNLFFFSGRALAAHQHQYDFSNRLTARFSDKDFSFHFTVRLTTLFTEIV